MEKVANRFLVSALVVCGPMHVLGTVGPATIDLLKTMRSQTSPGRTLGQHRRSDLIPVSLPPPALPIERITIHDRRTPFVDQRQGNRLAL